MPGPRLHELRLTAFKSYSSARLPLSQLTVLIGRNASGKSNALDALEILARLASGDEVRDALTGNRRDQHSIRGGLEGCPPYGQSAFALGVRVADAERYEDANTWIELDVKIQVEPDVRVVAERLEAWLPRVGRRVTVLETRDPDPDRGDIVAEIFNNRRGVNPGRVFRSSHLLTAQLPLRIEGANDVEQDILEISALVSKTLAGVFQLDPVPHLMRGYVPEQDAVLRRTGENLSATIATMRRDDRERFNQLVAIVRDLPESDIRGLEVARGGFGDVMIALKERRGRSSVTIPARQMSDGMLRLLAIATALLSGGRELAVGTTTVDAGPAPVCLVLEELENGLHPSQAARVLRLVREAATERGLQVVMTTHSPALLNALEGDDHPGVLVCERDRTSGWTTVRRLVDLPGYLALMASSRLGDSATSGRLADAGVARPPVSARELLGIG